MPLGKHLVMSVFDIRVIYGMRCEIDIKKFAYTEVTPKGGGAPVAPAPRSATAFEVTQPS